MKSALRKEILGIRDSKSSEFLRDSSRMAVERLLSLPEFQNAKNVMFYVSFGSEVGTERAIEEAIKKGKKVSVPCTGKETNTMAASQISGLGELEEGKYGIREPKEKKEIPAAEIDIVVVPGVAFDRQGYRVGYGKGFYDRFLSNIGPKTTKIGLAFGFQLVDSLPREGHDIPVDKVITEKGIVE